MRYNGPESSSSEDSTGRKVGHMIKRAAGALAGKGWEASSDEVYRGTVDDIHQVRLNLPTQTHLRGNERPIPLVDTAITEATYTNGVHARLLGVVFVGESVLGIVAMAKSRKEQPSRIFLNELPYGIASDTDDGRQLPTQLASYGVTNAGQQIVSGSSYRDKKFTFGPLKSTGRVIVSEDAALLRSSAEITFTATDINVRDVSMHGTDVLKISDLLEIVPQGLLDPAIQEFQADLHANAEKWAPGYIAPPASY